MKIWLSRFLEIYSDFDILKNPSPDPEAPAPQVVYQAQYSKHWYKKLASQILPGLKYLLEFLSNNSLIPEPPIELW